MKTVKEHLDEYKDEFKTFGNMEILLDHPLDDYMVDMRKKVNSYSNDFRFTFATLDEDNPNLEAKRDILLKMFVNKMLVYRTELNEHLKALGVTKWKIDIQETNRGQVLRKDVTYERA